MKKNILSVLVMGVATAHAMEPDLESGIPGRMINDSRLPIIHSSNGYHTSQLDQRCVINTMTINNNTMNVQQYAQPVHIVPLEYDRTMYKIAAAFFAMGTISGLSIGMHHCK